MQLIKKILSIPKTLLFNFKVFPLKLAFRLPILISYNVEIANIHKDCILINSKLSRFMIKIGTENGSDGVNCFYKKGGYFDVRENGKIVFNGKATFASGLSIRVDSGNLIFGDNFSCNKNCFFACNKNVIIGNNVLLGWNVNIRDSDGHTIFNLDNPNVKINTFKSVLIGNHVWIAANVDILKGTEIPDDCIIGYNSCVNKKFLTKNCIIAGYPAEVVRKNVGWK